MGYREPIVNKSPGQYLLVFVYLHRNVYFCSSGVQLVIMVGDLNSILSLALAVRILLSGILCLMFVVVSETYLGIKCTVQIYLFKTSPVALISKSHSDSGTLVVTVLGN